MPRRAAVGTSLIMSSISSIRALRARGKARAALREAARNACVEGLEQRTLLSNTWFVAPWGNDGASGSGSQPFHSIQQAANVANWGDTVLIRGGTYHETVHPAHGGVTFQSYNGESVTISGADPVTGWSWNNGSVWRASMPWDKGEGNNQVFVNGQMVNEARWPNTGTDLSYPSLEYAQNINAGGGWATLYDSHLSGGWQGATIHIMPGDGWYAQTGSVTGSGNGWLQFTYQQDHPMMVPKGGNGYYLYGKFQALNSPGQWFRDNNGQLYLWAPNSGNPNSLDVEAKHRDYAFDLGGDPNTTIRGINIFAATIHTDGGSSNLLIDRLNATYLSQFTWQNVGWDQPGNSGIQLNGNNSTLQNSNIAWSPGDGVYINASNVRVTNNIIHDVDYNGGDSAGIHNFGSYASIDHNVIYNTGRCGIIDKGWAAQVIGNTIHDAMLQTSDGGAIYTIHQDGSGSQIAWNTIYNVHNRVSDPFWFAANGIFLDDYCSNFSIHDNSIANTDAAVKLNYTSRGNQVYNNVLAGNGGSVVGNNGGDWSGTTIHDNILYGGINGAGGGYSAWNNSFRQGSPNLNVPPPPSVPPPPPAPTPGPTPTPTPTGGGSSGNTGNGSASGNQSGGYVSNGNGGGGNNSGGNSSGAGNTGGSSSTGASSSGSFVGPLRNRPSFVGPTVPKTVLTQIKAASFDSVSGAQTAANGSVSASGGNWLRYSKLNFGGGVNAVEMQLVAAAQRAGLQIQLRLDGLNGPVVGTIHTPTGKSKPTTRIQTARVRKITGVHDLYVVFVGRKGQVDINWLQFTASPQKKK